MKFHTQPPGAHSLITRLTLSLAALSLMVGCSRHSDSGEDKTAPNTGMNELEQQTGDLQSRIGATPSDSSAPAPAPVSAPATPDTKPAPPTPTAPVSAPQPVRRGEMAYVSSESVRVRTSPTEGDNIAGRLNLNDKVEIVDPTPIGEQKYVVIRVVTSQSKLKKSQNYYMSANFLNSTPKEADPIATSATAPAVPGPKVDGQRPAQVNRLFIVTNVATEKLRVYERCAPGESCVNRLILETDVVNGEDEDGTHTNVGYYKVTTWEKFYESPASVYPAWYKPGYPPVPKPGNRTSWFDSSYMPGGVGQMRGAFGWYTAKVGPNPNGQWTHGTAGWGEDKKEFVLFKESFWGKLVNLFTSIRSHGCTRTDNESIAYLRSLVPLGTPLIKIYAKEGLRDGSRTAYSKKPGRWDYILTKNGHQVTNNHQLADRATVLAQGTPQSEWLDQGSYEVNQYPEVADGDLYKLGDGAFTGVFVIDEGTVYNYKHPSKMGRGGFSDQFLPEYMLTNDGRTTSATRSSRWSTPSSGGDHSTPAYPFRENTGG